ncbi:hypothetical protein GOC74_13755 [Halomicrobium mukohataei]|uniref:Carbohydrate kinase PfkB domain-containing protein n=1 Tax=Halomicrobium mukohataei TaxID=57705 RepID=A0A847UCZ1_9EURY|nr:PfkB family carbohydrate kinase [Halomicrobium mukohataei]NLV10989.1 hypothetical protein [Halomicrobium mukohataei]
MSSFDDETEAAVAVARAQLPETVPSERVVFGFDGYVDRVREVVADRHDPDDYDRLDTLAGFGDRVHDSVAADSSLSFEWLQRGTRTGGHTSHLARAFGSWGFDPVMIGMYGQPVRDVFADEFADCELHSLGQPGYTDAVEFDDGKLMLIENGTTMDLDWSFLTDQFDRERLRDRLDGAALLGTGYWAETPDLPDVLDGIAGLWDDIEEPPETVLVDPGDVRKLDAERLDGGTGAIGRLAAQTRVVVSANRAETQLLAETYGDGSEQSLAAKARTLRETFDASLFVSHGVDRSLVAGADGTTDVAVPSVDDPELTTSAGDHFNAGLALALVAGVDPAGAVVVGNAVAGAFVRSGEPPTFEAVRAFVDEYESKF